MAITLGTWKALGPIANFDFGITEKLGIANNPNRAPSIGPQYQPVLGAKTQTQTNTQSNQQYGPTYSGPQGSATGGGGGQAPLGAPAGNQTLQDNANRQVQDLGAIVDRDYETTMGMLANEESTLRGQAATSEQQIKAGYAPAKTAIQEEQATREQGLQSETQTANTQEQNSLQQARDLFRQIQQQNITQLSGLGISSSSVAEALAERLGVETARRIAGVTGSANEIRQNIAKETTRVQTYYKQKLSDLEGQLSASLAGVQQQLLEGINKINSARQIAASEKANQRANIINNAQNTIAQLQADAQNFAQELQQWNARKQAALQESAQFTVTKNDFSPLYRANEAVQNLPSAAGFNYTPEFTISPTGQVTTRITGGKKEEDDLSGFANF